MRFSHLPAAMQAPSIQKYANMLHARRATLCIKRAFDILLSLLLIALFSPVLLCLAIAVKADSKGPVFYRQTRVGRLGKDFRIFKFRTMVQDADKRGPAVTVGADSRITRVGRAIRKCRLDELPQLFNVLCGDMSFVGPRPEVPKYVQAYQPVWRATLLLRPGITAPSSIAFRNEDEILAAYPQDPDRAYIELVLPRKMEMNLAYLENLSLGYDLKTMWRTVAAVLH